jgi:hypothetical protein
MVRWRRSEHGEARVAGDFRRHAFSLKGGGSHFGFSAAEVEVAAAGVKLTTSAELPPFRGGGARRDFARAAAPVRGRKTLYEGTGPLACTARAWAPVAGHTSSATTLASKTTEPNCMKGLTNRPNWLQRVPAASGGLSEPGPSGEARH